MFESVTAGIQVDVTAVTREIGGKKVERPSCDHSCWDENYRCPAAAGLQAGFVTSGYAFGHLLVRGVRNVAGGLRRVAGDEGAVEVNLFGGNPELHPDLLAMTRQLSTDGFAVQLSIPGRRFIHEPDFCDAVIDTKPQVLAFSADDFESPEHLDALVGMSADRLLYQWRQVPYHHSQRQKAIEAIYAAKRLQQGSSSPIILFNVAVHLGNVFYIKKLLFTLWKRFKDALINPYPAQTAFSGNTDLFDKEHIAALKAFIEDMALGEPLGVIQRPYYWTLLKALCKLYECNAQAFCAAISGKGVWNCHFEGNRYIQVGRRSPAKSGRTPPGGYLNCFWNPSGLVDDIQVWDMGEGEMDAHLVDYGSLSCLGCLMPRLLFDEENMVKGLYDDIALAYQAEKG